MKVSRILLVAVVLVAVGGVARAEVVDRVLAVVSGDLILLSDVKAAAAFGLATPDGPDPTASVLSQLIDRELVLAEVDRYAPPEPSSADVDREFEKVRGRFPSPQAFQSALARTGLDERQLRGTLRDNLRILAYINQRFIVVSPTEDEARAYYNTHRADFSAGGRARPFEEVRADAAAGWMAERRTALVQAWVTGLRRRADIIDLYLPSLRRPAGSR